MVKEALEYLVGLGRPVTHSVFGRIYATQQLLPMKEPVPETLNVTTLSALIGYVGADCDLVVGKGKVDRLTAHVVSPTEVKLYAPAAGDFKVRPELLCAKPLLRRIPFGEYISGEEMVILLQTCFVRNAGDWAKVITVAGNVTDGAARDYADDGISQAVTIRSGVASKADVAMPNPVRLAPYRTFPEIEQPVSSFVFRARSGGEHGKPTFALFESDGGAWRIEAMQRVADWLKGAADDSFPTASPKDSVVDLNVIY